jgi:NADPH-dependent 2,4-dienoyl-CoA reductase/sulfur reductase-like enzyme
LNTEFLKNVELFDRDKSVIVNEFMQNSSGIYAAGDLARFPNFYENGAFTRIEHWGVAQNQGRIAALNILGKKTPFQAVPYFWTVQFPGSMRYVGHCDSFDDVILMEESKKFVALYIHKSKVTTSALFTCIYSSCL